MKSSGRPPMRFSVLIFVLGWAGFVLLGLTLKLDVSRVIESSIFLAFLLNGMRYAAFRSMLAALKPYQLLATGGLIGLILAGQLTDDDQRTWPFLKWSMYCWPYPQPSIYEYHIELASGESIHFPFLAIAPTRAPTQVKERIDKFCDKLLAAPTPRNLEDLLLALQSLTELYNRRHPEAAIRAFTVQKTHIIPAKPPQHDSKGHSERYPIMRVNFSDE